MAGAIRSSPHQLLVAVVAKPAAGASGRKPRAAGSRRRRSVDDRARGLLGAVTNGANERRPTARFRGEATQLRTNRVSVGFTIWQALDGRQRSSE